MKTVEEFLFEDLIAHVEWLRDHGKERVSQTRDDAQLNAFNQGRVDAAESILTFYENEKRRHGIL